MNIEEKYNVKITHFATETRVKVYKKSIQSITELTKKDKMLNNYDFMKYARLQFAFEYSIAQNRNFKEFLIDDDIGEEYEIEFNQYIDVSFWELLKEYDKILQLNNEMAELQKEEKQQKYIRDTKSRAVQKVYDLGKSNNWEWFITLTFNPEKVDSLNYLETSTKMSKWINNIKRICPNMKYIGVPELHNESKRYHYHFLMSNVDNLTFSDSGKVAIGKYTVDKISANGKGNTIFNLEDYKFGWTTATKVKDSNKSVGYLCKYITKEMTESVPKGKKKYWSSRNLDKPIEDEILLSPAQLKNYEEYLKTKNPSYTKEIDMKGSNYKNKLNIYEFADSVFNSIIAE